MLERRVDTLETDMKEVKASLNRLELGFARIEEKFSYLATKEDLARTEIKLGSDIAQLDKKLSSEIIRVETKLGSVETKLSAEIIRVENRLGNEMVELKGRIEGAEGRMTGLSDRVAGLPTVWTQLSIVFATWGIGSGILIFALTRLLAK